MASPLDLSQRTAAPRQHLWVEKVILPPVARRREKIDLYRQFRIKECFLLAKELAKFVLTGKGVGTSRIPI